MNTMNKYRDYNARVEYDDDDEIFVGHLAGIKDIVSFHGATVDELKQNFHEAVDHYLEVCEKLGEKPQKPYSGRLMLKLMPEIHAAIATTAEAHGKSINQWVSEILHREAQL